MVLLLANLMFVGVHLAACRRRGFRHLTGYALLMPFYWVMISVAAWKGLWQFFTRPFYWEKTIHGLDQTEPEPAAGELPGTNHEIDCRQI